MKLFPLTILLCLIPQLTLAAEAVATQMVCDDTKKIVTSLKEEYNEKPIIIGKATDEAGSLMTLWMSPTTGSWTILATKGDVSCIIGVGRDLQIIPSKGLRT